MKQMVRNIGKLVCSVSMAMALSSCASVISGTTQKVTVQSRPSEASIKVFDREGAMVGTGATPCTLALKRGSGFFSSGKYRIVIEKNGYVTREVEVNGRINGWYIGGNFVIGGAIGWLIVDPLTGAMWSLSPSDVRAELPEQQASLLESREGFTVLLKSQVPDEYQSLLKPIVD